MLRNIKYMKEVIFCMNRVVYHYVTSNNPLTLPYFSLGYLYTGSICGKQFGREIFSQNAN